ncbi:ParB-like protein [Phenylobacterium sp.]|uniref:ParB-like protein n=1 Tax=Phenylobacterium sp. TaxID=1871053 RepID=UPI0012051A15|nr:ParB-like protein [Phenylobacterium sp.]THD56539.1 MAG: chromosome partitioning protein ParB [Phenylobacterium sp.]
MSAREPVLNPIPIKSLRPTQMTVGFREVAEKRRQWREQSDEKGSEFLGRHMVPVVVGPKGHPYVIDHHHLCRALMAEGVADILVNVMADLRALKKPEFWIYLDNRDWCHLYDSEGQRRDFADVPSSLAGMTDDPYRSLAGELRRAGGFAKDITPFSEFIWADFLRRRVKLKLVEGNFSAALTQALQLAKDEAAAYLPGWCGPNPIV